MKTTATTTFTVDARPVRAAQACQATKDVRYYLVGVFFGKCGRIVGTNGHILTMWRPHHPEVYFRDASGEPVDAIVKINGKIPRTADTLTFDVDTRVVTTEKGKAFTFALVDGKYPDFDRIIPGEHKAEPLNNRVAFDPAYVAKTLDVFGADTSAEFILGHDRDAVLIKGHDIDGGDQIMVVMPRRI